MFKKYYCKKTYGDIIIGNYYDCKITTDELLNEIIGKNKKGLGILMIYDNISNLYINFNNYFVLAAIYDRKIKLKILNNV